MFTYAGVVKELRDQWILQLHKEFDSICYAYGLKLKIPSIIVAPLNNTWGYWDAARRLICISETLVKSYHWDVVINVLKHEMAHQIVTDIFHAEEQHGEYFKRACQVIGLQGIYTKASLSAEDKFVHWKDEDSSCQDSSLLSKIEKLLNLASSSNENEAALAMEKVQELYEKYNIQKMESGVKQNYFTLTLNFKKRKCPTMHFIAGGILQNHFFVRVIFSELYDSLENCSHKTIEILGTKENVLMAEYVFYFLVNRIDVLWQNYSKGKKLGAKYKASYQRGILAGFDNQLDVAQQMRHKNTQYNTKNVAALVKVEIKQLDSYVRSVFPKLVSSGRRGGGIYTEHFNQGIEEGKKINLHKSVHTQNTGEKKFLANVL